MSGKLSVALVVLLLVAGAAYSQSGNRSLAPTSLSPGSTATTVAMPKTKKKAKTGLFSPKREQVFRVKKQNVKHTARYEFYERVEQAAKEKQRILRKLAKPQYSDPRYFGHKRMPKKRPPHKMRYCGECSIRH